MYATVDGSRFTKICKVGNHYPSPYSLVLYTFRVNKVERFLIITMLVKYSNRK